MNKVKVPYSLHNICKSGGGIHANPYRSIPLYFIFLGSTPVHIGISNIPLKERLFQGISEASLDSKPNQVDF